VVNLQTGVQTVLTQGGLLDHMVDFGLDASGNLIVANAGSGGSLIRVNPSGVQTAISSGGLIGLDGGTVDVNHGGTIYVSALSSGGLASRILAIDPATGVPHTVASGGNLSLVAGLVVFNSGGGHAAVMPSNPALSSAGNAAPGSTAVAPTTGTASIANGTTIGPGAVNTAILPQDQPAQLSAPASTAILPAAAIDSLFADWDVSLHRDALPNALTSSGMDTSSGETAL
jgi:hypothetical protein